MRTKTLRSWIMALLVCCATASFAIVVGDNITIADGNTKVSSTTSWWLSSMPGAGEDNEVEPGAVWGQTWDLEGMFLDQTKLTVVAGYDMKTATGQRTPGDIFIDVDGDWGMGGAANNYGYDYVLDLSFSTLTYSVYELLGSVSLQKTTNISASNPWRRYSGGSKLTATPLAIEYQWSLSGADAGGVLGFDGLDQHWAATVDLAPVIQDIVGTGPLEYEMWIHMTMNCGNDNMMGYTLRETRVPDAGSSLAMLAVGFMLLGTAFRSLKRE